MYTCISDASILVATLWTREWGDRRSGGDSASAQKSGGKGRQLATSALKNQDSHYSHLLPSASPQRINICKNVEARSFSRYRYSQTSDKIILTLTYSKLTYSKWRLGIRKRTCNSQRFICLELFRERIFLQQRQSATRSALYWRKKGDWTRALLDETVVTIKHVYL